MDQFYAVFSQKRSKSENQVKLGHYDIRTCSGSTSTHNDHTPPVVVLPPGVTQFLLIE